MPRHGFVYSVLALAVASFYAYAEQVSPPTPAVKGRAPQVTITGVANETVPGHSPVAGHMLRAHATATDPDGDAVMDPLEYRWLHGSTEVSTQATYMATEVDVGQALTVEVTAHTDPAITDPANGSATTTVNVAANSAPEALGVQISGTAVVGSQLSGAYTYSDLDGDAQGTSTFRWLRADTATGPKTPISGATAQTYTLVSGDQGKFLFFEVTPKSSTGNPSVGSAVTSAASAQVTGTLINNFLTPDALTRGWSAADSSCRSLGARLPTREELQALFVDATSATAVGQANTEMCDVHGWPLIGRCGGATNYYWTSTPGDTGKHYSVALGDGSAYSGSDKSTSQVTCVR